LKRGNCRENVLETAPFIGGGRHIRHWAHGKNEIGPLREKEKQIRNFLVDTSQLQ